MNELNFNFNQCVKEISNFGSTTFQNICNGATNTVPWGGMDWVVIMGGVILFLVVLVWLLYIVYWIEKK